MSGVRLASVPGMPSSWALRSAMASSRRMRPATAREVRPRPLAAPGYRDHPMAPRLLATSDLHVNRAENEAVVEDLHPTDPGDWLVVAGDVGHVNGGLGRARKCHRRVGRTGKRYIQLRNPGYVSRGRAGDERTVFVQ